MGRSPLGIALWIVLLSPAAVVSRVVAEQAVWRIPSTLTLPEALKIFRQRGLDLLIAETALQSARADKLQAGAVANPLLSGGLGSAINYDANQCTAPGCSPFFWNVVLSDQGAIFDMLFRQRHYRLRVMEQALQAARLERADAQRQLESQLKQQYIQAAFAHQSVDFARDVYEAMRRMWELNQVRYRAGAISEVDVLKVETAKLEAEQQLERATQALRVANLGVAFLLGARGTVPDFDIDAQRLEYRLPDELSKAEVRSLLDEALQKRPDLQAIRWRTQQASTATRLAKRQRYPDIALAPQITGQGRGPQATNPMTAILNLSITVPSAYLYQGEIAQAKAQQQRRDVELKKLEAQVAAEVQTAHANFASSRRRVERMQSQLLERARRTRDLVELQYEKGAASLLEYIDAQRTFISNNVQYLTDLAGYWSAVFQLEQAIGRELTPSNN